MIQFFQIFIISALSCISTLTGLQLVHVKKDKTLSNFRIIDLFVVQFQHESLHFDVDDRMLPRNYQGKAVSVEIPNYIKASVILRMLQHAFDIDAFWQTIHTYLYKKEHHPDNFWEALKNAYDEINPGSYDIKEMMYPWSKQKGYPVLNILHHDADSVNISIKNLDVTNENRWIPINYATETYPNFNISAPLLWLNPPKKPFNPYNQYFILPIGYRENGWIIFNIQQTGYYRVNYDDIYWQKIALYLNSENYRKIHVLNRAQIIDDAFHFLLLHKLKPNTFWVLTKYLSQETDYIAWYPMFKAIQYISISFSFPEMGEYYIKEQLRKMLNGLLQIIKYEEKSTDNDFTKALRQEAVQWACFLKLFNCLKMANNQLKQHLEISTKFSPLWKKWTYCYGLQTADNTTWHQMLNKIRGFNEKILYFLTCPNLNHLVEINNYILTYYTRDDAIELHYKAPQYNIYNNKSSISLVSYNRIITQYALRHFVFTIANNTRNNETFKKLLNDFETITPSQVTMPAALLILINNVYSYQQLDKIYDFFQSFEEYRIYNIYNKIKTQSSETEEELLPEPVKPVFDEQDLNNLVQYVKDLTILPSIKDSDWKEDCHTVIREYFENPGCALLSIYFEVDTLRARLSVPEDDQSEFVYFLRTPWHVFTVDNFHATVIFGSINRNAMMCVLKAMENMYAPAALNNGEWPEIIRNNVFFNLHNFLMCLTEWVYKPLGLTKLYVPQEDLPDIATSPRDEKPDLSEEDGQYVSNKLRESEKAQIDRFEGIVRYWIKQIREALANTSKSTTGGIIFDELQHWTAIYFDLCSLHDQLSSKEIQSILCLLENVHSPSVDSFQYLTLQLHEGLEQAASNVTYLNVLSEACNNLKCPNEIEEPITRILLLILFIWTESPFYNIPHNIEILCEAINTEIVQQCKNYVELQAILEGDAENGINILRKCISCCETYRIVYNKVTSITARIGSNRDWQMNEQLIFKRIDTFTQRCYDVIEICNALIVFGKRNKVEMIGGPKGTEHEDYCRRIENLFYENLEEIKLVRDNILDITNSTWLKNMQKFRDSVTDLENMVVNLIDRIFEEVQTIEEGIEAIYALQRFKYRASLQDTLSTKWVQVWKMFGKEIESCSNSMTRHNVYHPLLQHHTENSITLCISKYLERLYHMMIDASDWIGECTAQKYILEQYKKVKSSIDNKMEHNPN